MLPKERRVIDITANPELLRIVREMQTTQQPYVLRADDQEVAVLTPAKPAAKRRTKRAKTKADYEAFRAAAGGWRDVDTDKLIADIYADRTISDRPPVEL